MSEVKPAEAIFLSGILRVAETIQRAIAGAPTGAILGLIVGPARRKKRATVSQSNDPR